MGLVPNLFDGDVEGGSRRDEANWITVRVVGFARRRRRRTLFLLVRVN